MADTAAGYLLFHRRVTADTAAYLLFHRRATAAGCLLFHKITDTAAYLLYIFHTTAFLFYSAIKTRLVVRIPPKSERKNTPKAPWCSHIEPYQSSNTYKHSYIWVQTEFNRLQKVTIKIVGLTNTYIRLQKPSIASTRFGTKITHIYKTMVVKITW